MLRTYLTNIRAEVTVDDEDGIVTITSYLSDLPDRIRENLQMPGPQELLDSDANQVQSLLDKSIDNTVLSKILK